MKVVAFFCIVIAASLASPQRGQSGDRPLRSSPPGAGQTLHIPLTRFAYVDSLYLAEKGIRLERDSTAEADLKAFGASLNVDLFDIGKVQGAVFIGDDRIDLSDRFLAALKAKTSRTAPLKSPAIDVPAAPVAFINRDAFADPQTGITSLIKALRTLEQEFKPRKDELQNLREQLAAASGDRKRELEVEIRRKQEAGQAALDKRFKAVANPIYADIGRALSPFCKMHGIFLIFDINRIKKTVKLPPFDLPLPADAPDVTEAFVSAYNQGVLTR